MRLLFAMKPRIRVVYYHEIPMQGGFILASNHISHFDPPIITPLLPRRIDWIGMTDLFRGRILRGLFTGLNVIPIARNEPDRAALRIAVKRLREGRVVGIFPEGGIRDGAGSIINGAAMKQGVTLLSTLSRAPIIPCVILGSDRLYNLRNWLPWRRPKIWIGCGESHSTAARSRQPVEGRRAAVLQFRDRKAQGAPLRGLRANTSRLATSSKSAHERTIGSFTQYSAGGSDR